MSDDNLTSQERFAKTDGIPVEIPLKTVVDHPTKEAPLEDFLPEPLAPICAGDIYSEPPERQWAMDNWIPKGSVTGLGGAPGSSKSTIAQQICTHKALGIPYLDSYISQGPALYVTCEDDQDELTRRQININKALKVEMSKLRDLFLMSRVGEDSLLVNLQQNYFHRTKFFDQFDQMLGDYRIELVFLDLVPDFWNGNEIMRQHVNAFVKTHLAYLAQRHNCGLVALYHPSQAGKASGTGESGSTSWEGSFRSRIYLDREDNTSPERTIHRKKSNYSETNDGVKVVWDKGYLAEVSKQPTNALEKRNDHVKEAFMSLMQHCEDRKIGVTVGANSNFCYYKQFPKMWVELDKRHTSITGKQFQNAFTSLVTSGLIIQYTPRGKGVHLRINNGQKSV